MADLPGPVHFIAEAPVSNFVWFRIAMLSSEVAPLGTFLDVAILHQSCCLLGRARAEIQAHQRFGADGFAPGHEVIGAKLIGVQRIPRFVENKRPIFLWPNSIKPVVAGNEVSAGIANDGNAEFLDLAEDIRTKTV